jgi:chromosome segregation ATPase
MTKHLLLTTLCLGMAQGLIGQNQESPSMQSLLAEIHQLRLAVERMGSIMPRMQIVMQRMQLQEQRVAELSRQLKDVQNRLIGTSAQQARLAPHIQELEGRIREEQDPNRRKALQEQHSGTKGELERTAQMVQQLSAQEAEVAGALRQEQSKVDELSERLNTLERALDGSK